MIAHLPRVEFRCPKCLGGNFGTSGLGPQGSISEAEGYCNGPGYRGDGSCKFTWKRSEDYRVFYIIQVTAFESAEEFNEVDR